MPNQPKFAELTSRQRAMQIAIARMNDDEAQAIADRYYYDSRALRGDAAFLADREVVLEAYENRS
jgi:hypothetical protein